MYCNKCGSQVSDDMKFCANCGAEIKDNKNEAQGGQKTNYANNTQSATHNETEDVRRNKGMAVLSYIGILAIIPYLSCKDSKFAQFHAKQGLNLLIIEAIWTVVSKVLSIFKVTYSSGYFIYSHRPWFISLIISVVFIFLAIVAIMGIVYVVQGKTKELPLVGKIKIVK